MTNKAAAGTRIAASVEGQNETSRMDHRLTNFLRTSSRPAQPWHRDFWATFSRVPLRAVAASSPSRSQQGVIVRTNLGILGLQNVCLLNGCTVVENLDGNQNQVFLVRPVQGLLPNLLAGVLRLVPGIIDTEVDQVGRNSDQPVEAGPGEHPPAGLWDNTPVSYYGTQVPDGYVNQPAVGIIRLNQAHSDFQRER